jgi:hypothetical protein
MEDIKPEVEKAAKLSIDTNAWRCPYCDIKYGLAET